MTEISVISGEIPQRLLSNDAHFHTFNPAYRSNIPQHTETSGLSSLAQRFRENWLKCNPSFRESDDSLTNLTWLFDMSPFSLESETHTAPQHKSLSTDRFTVYSNAKISWQPTHPYAGSLLDPQVRMDYRTKWTGKPPFSYASLICLAMRELGKPKVTLSDIYGWIMTNFAYYRHTDSSWQNSVRHNLSLNKCFEKVPREKGERGKGGFWRVNPRHADWLEANLAKCRRAAPPPGPPPPIPRSLLLEKQQQQFQHQQPDGATSNVYFSFPPTAHPSQQHSQHIISPNNPTLICYPNTAACHTTPDISNEVEAIATPEYRTTANPNNTLPQIQHLPTQQQVPHVRRRKTPPCAMYPSGGGESGTAEADLVEVVQRPQQSSQQHNYPAFSSKKRLALSAASATVSRNRFSSSSSSMWLQHGGQGMKREPTKGTHGYNETKWWKADGNNSRTSHLQTASNALRRRRMRESMDSASSDQFYSQARKSDPYQHQCTNHTSPSSSSTDNLGSPSHHHRHAANQSPFYNSNNAKRRVETQVRQSQQTMSSVEETPVLLPDSIGLPCLDSLPNFNVEPSDLAATSGMAWKDDFLDFPGVLPWQTVSPGDEVERNNLTVECCATSSFGDTTAIQSSSSTSQSPLASFASFGQSTTSSTSSNADSGVASLVNPSDGLDLGPLDLDFDTVSSALNDLVESNGNPIPPLDVDFSDLNRATSQKPPFNQNGDFSNDWSYGDVGGFYEGLLA